MPAQGRTAAITLRLFGHVAKAVFENMAYGANIAVAIRIISEMRLIKRAFGLALECLPLRRSNNVNTLLVNLFQSFNTAIERILTALKW